MEIILRLEVIGRKKKWHYPQSLLTVPHCFLFLNSASALFASQQKYLWASAMLCIMRRYKIINSTNFHRGKEKLVDWYTLNWPNNYETQCRNDIHRTNSGSFNKHVLEPWGDPEMKSEGRQASVSKNGCGLINNMCKVLFMFTWFLQLCKLKTGGILILEKTEAHRWSDLVSWSETKP